MIKTTMLKRTAIAALLIPTLVASVPSALAQRTGDSARVTVGIVERAERVQLKSDAGRNALIGGALGWAIARNQSTGRQIAAAAGGAALGGGATSHAEGSNMAMQYTVRTSDGSAVRVITDQTEVRIGDCVLVEEVGDTANIRRKDPAMCQPKSEAVHSQVKGELQDDASQCAAAKQRLLEAKNQEEIDVAMQVMKILCND